MTKLINEIVNNIYNLYSKLFEQELSLYAELLSSRGYKISNFNEDKGYLTNWYFTINENKGSCWYFTINEKYVLYRENKFISLSTLDTFLSQSPPCVLWIKYKKLDFSVTCWNNDLSNSLLQKLEDLEKIRDIENES